MNKGIIFPSKTKAYSKILLALIPIFLSKEMKSIRESLSFFEKYIGVNAYSYLYITLSFLKAYNLIDLKNNQIVYKQDFNNCFKYQSIEKISQKDATTIKNIEYINKKLLANFEIFKNTDKNILLKDFTYMFKVALKKEVKIKKLDLIEIDFNIIKINDYGLHYAIFDIESFVNFYKKYFNISFDAKYIKHMQEAKNWWDERIKKTTSS